MLAHAALRARPARNASPRSWIIVTVVALLAWGLLATTAAGPAETPSTALRLAAVQSAVAEKRAATKFHVASFNILGYNHTAPGGDAKGFANGIKRMGYAFRVLENHHVNVVGFQEMQPQQYERFNELTGKTWNLYPGDRLERIAMHNSIAWKTSKWERLDTDYIKIPYFYGELVKMPIVKLRHRKTDRVVYFANFHNPADSYGNAQKWRDQARRKQIRLANRIADKGVPLIITGDMNEREKYFCNMVAKAPMRAANGGSNPKDAKCDTPDTMGIDWIFGSRSMDFTGYLKLESELVRKTTDHPFLVARAIIPRR